MKQYGIFDEQSDIRMHVCPANKTVYMFRTASIVSYIKQNISKLKLVNAFQPNCKYPTAQGYLVKLINLPHKSFVVPNYDWSKFDHINDTSLKGKLAVEVSLLVLSKLDIKAKEEFNIKKQISGIDIITNNKHIKIQVKLDSPIYKTGNIYVQVKESNPYHKI